MPAIAEQLKQAGREQGLEKGLQVGISVVLELRFPVQAATLAAQTSDLHSVELLQEFLHRFRSARNADALQAFLDQSRIR